MDDVLNLIRSIAEELEDPPEIPSHAEMRDAEQVEAAAQEYHTSESFVDDASPTLRSPSSPAEVEPAARPTFFNPAVEPSQRTVDAARQAEVNQSDVSPVSNAEVVARGNEAVRQTAVSQHVRFGAVHPEPTVREGRAAANVDVAVPERAAAKVAEPYRPEPAQVRGVEYQVASSPSGIKDTTVVDTLRVAAASVTAGLNQRGMPAEVDPTLGARVDSQQVTPSIRVVTMIPDGFPIDANHAFAIMDRDIVIPPSTMGPFPDMEGDFSSFPEPSSEEFVNQNSHDISMSEDLVDRSGF